MCLHSTLQTLHGHPVRPPPPQPRPRHQRSLHPRGKRASAVSARGGLGYLLEVSPAKFSTKIEFPKILLVFYRLFFFLWGNFFEKSVLDLDTFFCLAILSLLSRTGYALLGLGCGTAFSNTWLWVEQYLMVGGGVGGVLMMAEGPGTKNNIISKKHFLKILVGAHFVKKFALFFIRSVCHCRTAYTIGPSRHSHRGAS